MIIRQVVRMASLTVFIALLVACDSSTSSRRPIVYDFDLRTDTAGWRGAFSDYPAGREDDVEFVADHRALPDTLEPGSSLYHRGMNISDDLFMYFDKQIEGLRPHADYRASFRVEFASNAGQDCALGVGSSVFIKAGASQIEPEGAPDSHGIIRLNIDKGEQQNSGANALQLGDIRNDQPGCEDGAPFSIAVRESVDESIIVEADAEGRVWLLFGSESAFESPHELYFTRFRVELEKILSY